MRITAELGTSDVSFDQDDNVEYLDLPVAAQGPCDECEAGDADTVFVRQTEAGYEAVKIEPNLLTLFVVQSGRDGWRRVIY